MDYIIYFHYDREWVQAMNCRNCGTFIGTGQQFCPKCGAVINDVGIQSINSMPVMPSNFDLGSNQNLMNVQEPSNIINSEINQQNVGSNHINNVGNAPFNNGSVPTDNGVNNTMAANVSRDAQGRSEMYYGELQLPDEAKKSKYSWFIIAAVLIVIMMVGILVLPQFNKVKLSTYEADQYSLQYNANWQVDEEKENMTLYYSDNNSRFMFNMLSTFKALNSSVESETAKKYLYNQFYSEWADVDGVELSGGTETFLELNSETVYAKVDYVMTEQNRVGAFYVLISESNDKVISFMTYCTSENKEQIDNDVYDMLKTITYKRESESSIYDKFSEGEVKEYYAIGYMSYDVPECWQLDESRTKAAQYKSNIFQFVDGVSLLDIKGVTPYNSATGMIGTTYDSMKAIIANSYGTIKEEKTKTIDGKVWYIIVTPDYEAGGISYHNEIYFTMSATNKHLYYLEAYLSNETSEKKTKYVNDSIEYILESAELLKVAE